MKLFAWFRALVEARRLHGRFLIAGAVIAQNFAWFYQIAHFTKASGTCSSVDSDFFGVSEHCLFSKGYARFCSFLSCTAMMLRGKLSTPRGYDGDDAPFSL